MKKIFSVIWTTFRLIWKLFAIGFTLLTTVCIISVLVMFSQIFFSNPTVQVPDNAILTLEPVGNIVEQRSHIDPITRRINELAGVPLHNECFLQDILDTLAAAAEDPRITLLLIKPDRMGRAGLDQIQTIGKAVEQFKLSGKKVVAYGDILNQAQFALAACADEIFLHPMGRTWLHGFAITRLYFKELLNKLAVDFHIFRVGTFKSAVEPLERNDMSDDVKEANSMWLGALWEEYCNRVAARRGIDSAAFKKLVESYPEQLRQTRGDHARAALASGLINGIKTHQELAAYLAAETGQAVSPDKLQQVQYARYIHTLTPTYTTRPEQGQLIGIITAAGNIMYGKGAVNQIGSQPLIRQIQRAKTDKRIEALVLRITTGGGSAFASELIRQELLSFQKTGKKLVISMGSVAASGGYWLAADADSIMAAPTTLTGSIGIFGAIPTLEKSLNRLGVYSDGVGTGKTALYGNMTTDMSPEEHAMIQLSVENGYRQFLSIVARGRNMPMSKVKMIAEGRIWDGKSAQRIGLVDELGDLNDAIKLAASLAGLEQAHGVYIEMEGDSLQDIIASLAKTTLVKIFSNFSGFAALLMPDTLVSQVREAAFFTDPTRLYAHCLLPNDLLH